MSKSVSDFVLSGNCFYEQMCFMLAYCAKSIADLLKPCGDFDLGHRVTKSPYAMACPELQEKHGISPLLCCNEFTPGHKSSRQIMKSNPGLQTKTVNHDTHSGQVRNSEGPQLQRHFLFLEDILGPGEAACVDLCNF